MNKTVEDLITRRSVRKFKDHPVPKELLDQVIEAGLYAPSGRNFQSSIIIAVSNPELRNRIAEINCSRPNYLYDGSLTMGNLMNAAHAVGLGSCWIHRAREEFETEEFKELLKSLGVTGEYEGIGHCALGYSNEEPVKPPKRKEHRVFYID